MKKDISHMERFRVRTGLFASSEADGRNGIFVFALPGNIETTVIVSDQLGWEHVSVGVRRNRTPTWAEMCLVKDLFWGPEETVVQYHPPKSEYVNDHPNVLHLWRQIGVNLTLPPQQMV